MRHTIEELKALVEEEMRYPYTIEGMGDYDDAFCKPSPEMAPRIRDFIHNSSLYDTSTKHWRPLQKPPKTLNALSTAFASIVQAVIDHFRISNRQALTRRTRSKDEYLAIDPEIMIVGCSGSAFRHRELPQSSNYPSCVTPICARREIDRDRSQEGTQLGIFARLCFEAQPNRRFVYAVATSQSHMVVYQFDRTGSIFSKDISFNRDPEEFVSCILALVAVDEVKVGFDPTIRWKGRQRFIQTIDETFQPVEYQIDTTVAPRRLPSILGRGTTCWSVIHQDERFMIKDTWRLLDGRKEEEFLLAARDLPGVAQLVAYEIGPTASELRWVEKMPEHEDRQLIRLTFPEYGPTIEHFISRYQLLFAFRDAVCGHRNLLRAGVLHRDISTDNILLGKEGCEEGNRGILIDLDEAIWVKDRPRGTRYRDLQRMGSKSFQSTTILQSYPGPHSYLDDLESFFFVLAWLCIDFEGPQKRKRERPDILKSWSFGISGERGREKERQLEQFDEQVAPHVSPYFGDTFVKLLKELHAVCSEGRSDIQNSSIEDVYSEYLKAIDKAIASLRVKKRSLSAEVVSVTKRLKSEVKEQQGKTSAKRARQRRQV